MNEHGLGDAAILLVSLGEQEAAEVFKHLSPKEVQKLGEAIAGMRAVSRERVHLVINRFAEDARAQSLLVEDAGGYVRAVLKRALGEEKAGLLIDRILQGSDVSGIESLKWMEPLAVAELLRGEHPQIIAAILVHLEQEHAGAILMHLDERVRGEIMLRVATLEGIQPAALKDLNDGLFKVLSGGGESIRKTSLGGAKAAAEMINNMGGNAEEGVLKVIRAHDPELAQKIEENMFVFDDLVKLDEKAIQLLLRDVPGETLVISLKGAASEVREKVLRNMSKRAGDALREELETRGPMRLSEVEAQQKEVLKIARRLAEEGQITINNHVEDSYVA